VGFLVLLSMLVPLVFLLGLYGGFPSSKFIWTHFIFYLILSPLYTDWCVSGIWLWSTWARGTYRFLWNPFLEFVVGVLHFYCTILSLCCILRQLTFDDYLDPQHCGWFWVSVCIRSGWTAGSVRCISDFLWVCRFMSLICPSALSRSAT
jgi:hypothetical protein